MVSQVLDPELGATTQMGVQVHLLGTPGAIVSPRSRLDEHADQIRAELRAGGRPSPTWSDRPPVNRPRSAA